MIISLFSAAAPDLNKPVCSAGVHPPTRRARAPMDNATERVVRTNRCGAISANQFQGDARGQDSGPKTDQHLASVCRVARGSGCQLHQWRAPVGGGLRGGERRDVGTWWRTLTHDASLSQAGLQLVLISRQGSEHAQVGPIRKHGEKTAKSETKR